MSHQLHSIGPRFINVNNMYDAKMRKMGKEIAAEQNLRVHEGIYLNIAGPAFETVAETRLVHMFGADVVGRYRIDR